MGLSFISFRFFHSVMGYFMHFSLDKVLAQEPLREKSVGSSKQSHNPRRASRENTSQRKALALCSFLALHRSLSKRYEIHWNFLLQIDRKKWRITYRRKRLNLGKGEKGVREKGRIRKIAEERWLTREIGR